MLEREIRHGQGWMRRQRESAGHIQRWTQRERERYGNRGGDRWKGSEKRDKVTRTSQETKTGSDFSVKEKPPCPSHWCSLVLLYLFVSVL